MLGLELAGKGGRSGVEALEIGLCTALSFREKRIVEHLRRVVVHDLHDEELFIRVFDNACGRLRDSLHTVADACADFTNGQPRDHDERNDEHGDHDRAGKHIAAELLQGVTHDRADAAAAATVHCAVGIGCGKVLEILLPGMGNVSDDLRERHRRPAAEKEHPIRAAERIDSAAADDRNARRNADDGQDIGGPAAQSEEHAAQKFAENARAGHEQIGRKQYARRDADDAAGFALLPLLLKIRGARCGGFLRRCASSIFLRLADRPGF